MRDYNEKVQNFLCPIGLAFKQYSILNTKCIEIIDPEGPEKNRTTLR